MSEKKLKKIRLRTILILPYLLQTFTAVGLTGYFSLRNGQKAINELANKLSVEVGNRIELHLDNYMIPPGRVLNSIYDAYESQILPKDKNKVSQYFWQQINNFELDYILLGLASGKHLGTGRFFGDKQTTIDLVDPEEFNNHNLHIFKTDKQGRRQEKIEETGSVFVNGEFILQKEAWYKEALERGKPGWSSVYNWEVKPYHLSIAYSSPIYDQDKNIIGVLAIEHHLNAIGSFLKQLVVSPNGKAFVIERNGMMIGDSTGRKPFFAEYIRPNRQEGQQNKDRLIRTTVNYLQQKFGNLDRIKGPWQLKFRLEGENYFVQVDPWSDDLGLNWLVVVVVPESDFMEQINNNTRSTILLCIAELVLIVFLGIRTADWIARPILQLIEASKNIPKGKISIENTKPIKILELDTLSRSFDRAAQQLAESFTALADVNFELEKRVIERTTQLATAKEVADAASKIKSELLANMSHELRTPLNSILGYAQIMQISKTICDSDKKGVEIIYQSSCHLLNLINDTLDLSKIEAEKVVMCLENVDFPSFVRKVIEICEIQARQKGLKFIYQIGSSLPKSIRVDPGLLRQVLINLLSNAVKFTDNGFVKLLVTIERDGIQSDSVRIRFAISDSGNGIKPENIKKIFLPFEQGDLSTQEGTGLGLSISKKIVEMIGGELKVKSRYQEGSTFWFETEFIEGSHSSIQNGESCNRVSSEILGYEGVRRKILVVDDIQQNISVIVDFLEPLGFQIKLAENGQEGLTTALSWQPDLIITDLSMPVMDGYRMTQELRESNLVAKDLIIIILSARIYNNDRQQSEAVGANDFLSKPIKREILFSALEKHLNLDWTY